MSARKPATTTPTAAIGADAKGDFGEGSASYTNVDPSNPLRRSVMFSIRTSLADLASSRRKAVVQPPSDIFKQTRFSDLAGSKEAKGDLSSVILHSVSALSTKSTFGVPVGVDVTGVDPTTFSSTGRSFSTIVMPNIESHTARELQKEDTTVAYAFSEKYPQYNSSNLETLGVHPVASKNFVLVAVRLRPAPSPPHPPAARTARIRLVLRRKSTPSWRPSTRTRASCRTPTW